MSTLGDLQQRLLALLADAKAQGFNPADIIAPEVQDHFPSVAALRDQKEYIAELEDNEKALKEKNTHLEQELKDAKQAVDDIPADHAQLKIDLGQAHKSTELFRNLMNDAEVRATRYQEKLQKALETQTAAEEVDKKMKRLEDENRYLKDCVQSLAHENKNARLMFESLQDKAERKLEDKEMQLMALEKVIQVKDDRFAELQDESLAFQEQYNSLVELLDASNNDAASALNTATVRLRAAQQLQNATFSELQPLRRFYARAQDILHIYQNVFEQLLNTTQENMTALPDALWINLDSAAAEFEGFHSVRAALGDQGLEEDEFRNQLGEVAGSAKDMLNSFQVIAFDVSQFLQTLERQPNVWRLLRLKSLVHPSKNPSSTPSSRTYPHSVPPVSY